MRFNLVGGPCAGKSRTAPLIFSQLKDREVSVELVLEQVKPLAYRRQPIHKFDQIYIFGEQMNEEYQYLAYGVKNIVTDAPVWLGVIYSAPVLRGALRELYRKYDEDFPSVNIFLERTDKEYNAEGRYQTLDQAKELDCVIYEEMKKIDPNFVSFKYHERHKVLDFVLSKVDR